MRFSFQDGSVDLDMHGYETEVLATHSVDGVSPSPASRDLFTLTESPVLDQDERAKFHTVIAKLAYLAKPTRPDILTAISFLSTRVQSPTKADGSKLARGLTYLKHTGLCLAEASEGQPLKHDDDDEAATCRRAKATLKKQKPNEDSTGSPYVGHTIHADICFLKSHKPCLRLCEDITNYGALIPIKSKDKASIMDALATWFGHMLAHTGNAVRRLRTDNEATFSALTDDLAKLGILLQQSPSGQRSGKVERATRTNRDGLRTLLQDLPYQVPENLQTLAAIDVFGTTRGRRFSSANKSLYELLNVDRNATATDIILAFFREAKKYHPNLNPTYPEAKEKFQAITAAYQPLSDTKQCATYDATGSTGQQTSQQHAGDVDVIKEALGLLREKWRDEFNVMVDAMQRGDWSQVWEIAKEHRLRISAVVVPTILFVRYPPVFAVLRMLMAVAFLVYAGNLQAAAELIWRQIVTLSVEQKSRRQL
eukprot:gene11516-8200_t